MDGHSGVSNDEKNRADGQGFSLVLSLLKDASGSMDFIVHTSPNTINISSSLSPEAFLQGVGYQYFHGNCTFHHDRCFWLHMARFEEPTHGHFFDAERYHGAFKTHAENLGALHSTYQSVVDKLRISRTHEIDLFPELRSRSVPMVEHDPDAIPGWVKEEMPDRFAEVAKEKSSVEDELQQLTSIAGLLWKNGGALEDAVCDTFRDFGYQAEPTPKGETYDVNVDLGEGRRLLIEVTGIAGALKKESGKIGQALDVIQKHKGEKDRVVIALNSHRDEPLAERQDRDAITKDALSLVRGIEVIVVTTSTLFNIWRDARDDQETAKKRIDDLYAAKGGLFELAQKPTKVEAAS